MSVVSAHGHRVGEVEDLVVDEQHRRARLLVVTSGGLLGLGVTQRLVPVEAVIKVDERVHVELAMVTAHGDDPCHQAGPPDDHDPTLALAPPYDRVYRCHGVTPFWGEDYITPYFHRR